MFLFESYIIIWEGEAYKSTEHVYQAEKARLNGRPEVAAEIMDAETPLEAKNIAKKVYTPSSWEVQNAELMYTILKTKVIQNEDVRDLLLKSGNNIISECVPNQQYWSCGLSKEVAVKTSPDAWPGQNVLGRMWMTVRNELRAELKSTTATESGKRKDRSSEGDNKPAARARLNGTTPDKDSKKKNITKIPSPIIAKAKLNVLYLLLTNRFNAFSYLPSLTANNAWL